MENTPLTMNVLCVYDDEVADLLAPSPEEALDGHDITSVHSYQEMIETLRSKPPRYFQIVLCDVGIPLGMKDGTWNEESMSPLLQQRLFVERKIRGLGVFVPKDRSEHFINRSGEFIIVASIECWDISDKRDWSQLLEIILTPA